MMYHTKIVGARILIDLHLAGSSNGHVIEKSYADTKIIPIGKELGLQLLDVNNQLRISDFFSVPSNRDLDGMEVQAVIEANSFPKIVIFNCPSEVEKLEMVSQRVWQAAMNLIK